MQDLKPAGEGIGTETGEVGGVAGGFGGIGGLGGSGGIGGLGGSGGLGGEGEGEGDGEGAMQEVIHLVRHTKVGLLRQPVAHFKKHEMSKSTACAWPGDTNMAITAIIIIIKLVTLIPFIFVICNLIMFIVNLILT